jgi:hypothetical protein
MRTTSTTTHKKQEAVNGSTQQLQLIIESRSLLSRRTSVVSSKGQTIFFL